MENENYMAVTVIEEEKPETPERRKRLVSEISAKIKSAKQADEQRYGCCA